MKIAIFALTSLLVFATPAWADADIEKGENTFKKCKACHMVGEDAEKRVGPPLNNIFGSIAGTQADYDYSDAMIAAGDEGLVWTQETLAQYLEKPKALIKGTKMSFAGLRKEKDRENIIAYLRQFSPEAVLEEDAEKQ